MPNNIVLVEPEIPSNAGNIVRTCAATGTRLHMVRPLGFEVSDARLKRAGLDYWHFADIAYYDSIGEILTKYTGKPFFFFSTKGAQTYTEAVYGPESFLVFGKETKGLDEELLRQNYDRCCRIPMMGRIRSLNLGNSVAVVLYEALRQQGFPDFELQGRLTGI